MKYAPIPEVDTDAYQIGFAVHCEGKDLATARAEVMLANLQRSVYTRICKRDGHRWMDDSYGGPESGCMAAHCTRCGYRFNTTLY